MVAVKTANHARVVIINLGVDMYDLIIIGLGPAGISAGIYAARYKLNTLIIGSKPGGYATDASEIDNYPGLPGLSGIELMKKFSDHLNKFKLPSKTDLVKNIIKTKNGFDVITEKEKFSTKAVVIACGTARRRLEIPGESEFMGKGVAFCATCDAFFFRDKNVAIIGGADAALTAALELSHFASKVYLIYRKDTPSAVPELIDRVEKNSKIVLIPNTNLTKIIGNKKVEKIILDKAYQGKNELPLEGVFIEIGSIPLTDLIRGIDVKMDQQGFIIVDSTQQTNIEGIFAAGDSTTGSNKFQQIITACAEGAVASNSVFKYIKNNLLSPNAK